MPIYAYRCESCGFGKDVLQKLSDAPLTQCPECGKETFAKQVTAAGFQLKGSGWYVTDFRGGNSGGKAAAPNAEKSDGNKADGNKADGSSAGGEGAKTEGAATDSGAKSDTASASKDASKSNSATPAPGTPPSSGNA
ncbi:FmdB family regulatory protein [Caballeronia choica]|uniref:FmdB family regulatory protein n=1 Tax=Caballeronia choica TaxID=326476 RepID=A0A158FYF8_9BURK|nr:FmdB family zinc ribbon protein [Caballeronia choica]SAL24874.1 FmdB family regulatory protein [Caballeronia choica]